MKSNLILFWVVIVCQLSFAQYPLLLKGKIMIENANPENILVANMSIEKTVLTDINGNFSILASPNDLIVFSGIHIDYMRKMVEEDDFKQEMNIKLTAKLTMIEEVEVIDYKGLDAVSLGILPVAAKKYTQAERHLRTATSLDPSLNAGMMMGGSVSLDPLLNWISGRTKLLKSHLEVEKKIRAAQKLEEMFDEEYFLDELNISREMLQAFLNYAVNDEKIIESLKENNKFLVKFYITQVAKEFNLKQNQE